MITAPGRTMEEPTQKIFVAKRLEAMMQTLKSTAIQRKVLEYFISTCFYSGTKHT